MAAKRSGELAILREAMRLEVEGRQFYLKAVELAKDEDGREAFRDLADDEKEHFNLLERQVKALERNSQWLATPEASAAKTDLSKPLFPEGRDTLWSGTTTQTTDRDAVLFGLSIETKSYNLYRQAAVDANEPRAKDVFRFLAGQERRHFEVLMMRYEQIAGPVGWQY